MVAVSHEGAVKLFPGLAAIVVAVLVAYGMVATPFGSQQLSTIIFAILIVGVAITAVGLIVLERENFGSAVALLFFPIGLIGFALGPQLWLIALLVLVSVTVGADYVPYVLLALIIGLLLLTVSTSPSHRTFLAMIAGAIVIGTFYSIVSSQKSSHLSLT
jgi:hypothetical protein